jgi:hypothetical protein
VHRAAGFKIPRKERGFMEELAVSRRNGGKNDNFRHLNDTSDTTFETAFGVSWSLKFS